VRVLVTGAAGFVGRNLVPRLAAEHQVVALVRRPPAIPIVAARIVVKDLTDPDLATILPDDIDVVVHLAQAYLAFPSHAAEIFAVNAGSTQRLADWARSSGVRRFVLASSGSIYEPSTRLLREADPVRPLSFHPATKLMAEQILSYYEDVMDVVRLRLFTPYGPGQADRMIPRLIEAIGEGRPVRLSRGGEPRLNPIHVDDLGGIIGQAVAGAGAPVVNVAGPRAVSVAEIAETIGATLGRAPVFESHDIDPSGDLIADTTRMHQVFRVGSLVDPADGISSMTSALVARA
jgi:nucleoside-diphosphate-sugar epimerase